MKSQWMNPDGTIQRKPRTSSRGADSRRASNAAHKQLRESVIRLLHSMGCPAWKIDSGLARYMKNGVEQVLRYGLPGFPDVDGTISPTGVRICCECKTGKATLTDVQERIIDDLRASGALVYVVRDSISQADADAIRGDVAEVRRRWTEANNDKA